jgi:hypothetical protein
MVGKYVLPKDVVSPQRQWSLITVLDSGEEGDGALALGKWDGDPVLAMRWNGAEGSPIGNPQSRGLATWFIIPGKYSEAILATLSPEKLALVRNFIPEPKTAEV